MFSPGIPDAPLAAEDDLKPDKLKMGIHPKKETKS